MGHEVAREGRREAPQVATCVDDASAVAVPAERSPAHGCTGQRLWQAAAGEPRDLDPCLSPTRRATGCAGHQGGPGHSCCTSARHLVGCIFSLPFLFLVRRPFRQRLRILRAARRITKPQAGEHHGMIRRKFGGRPRGDCRIEPPFARVVSPDILRRRRRVRRAEQHPVLGVPRNGRCVAVRHRDRPVAAHRLPPHRLVRLRLQERPLGAGSRAGGGVVRVLPNGNKPQRLNEPAESAGRHWIRALARQWAVPVPGNPGRAPPGKVQAGGAGRAASLGPAAAEPATAPGAGVGVHPQDHKVAAQGSGDELAQGREGRPRGAPAAVAVEGREEPAPAGGGGAGYRKQVPRRQAAAAVHEADRLPVGGRP